MAVFNRRDNYGCWRSLVSEHARCSRNVPDQSVPASVPHVLIGQVVADGQEAPLREMIEVASRARAAWKSTTQRFG